MMSMMVMIKVVVVVVMTTSEKPQIKPQTTPESPQVESPKREARFAQISPVGIMIAITTRTDYRSTVIKSDR